MLTSVRSLLAATVLAGSVFAAVPAFAQDEESEASGLGLSVSGNVAVVSDYRFRGVSLSGGDPAVQGGMTVSHDSGFYFGTWGSSIDDGGTDTYGEMELDLFAGWTGQVAEGVTFDVGLLLYAYPTNEFGPVDYWEPYASISGSLGPVTAKLGAAYAWEQDGLGGNDNLYIYTRLDTGIPNTPISAFAQLGYTDGVLAPPLLAGTLDDSGFDWQVGASATVLEHLTVGVSYVGTEGPSIDGFTDDTVVGTLTLAI
jgi:uncharacterized protein (TIGR02001 family)